MWSVELPLADVCFWVSKSIVILLIFDTWGFRYLLICMLQVYVFSLWLIYTGSSAVVLKLLAADATSVWPMAILLNPTASS